MISKADFKVHMYPRAAGKSMVIYAYVTVRGSRSRKFSTGVKISKGETWVKATRSIKGNPNATQLLRSVESGLLAVFLSFRSSGLMPQPDEVVNKYYAPTAEPVQAMLLKDFLQHYYDIEAEKEGIVKEACTIEGYRIRIKVIYGYLQAKGLEAIALNEINTAFGDDLLHYLETEKGYSYEHIRKTLQLLKRALNGAMRKGLIVSNPIDVRIKRRKAPNPIFLSPEEFGRFSRLKPVGSRLKKAQDLFLWQCHTGHSLADMRAFRWEEHVIYHEGTPYVSQVRKKMANSTRETAKFPLSAQAVAIWQQYGGALPRLSEAQYNSALKELADMAGINKRVSSHVARRTAGTLWLNAGISMEVVAAMLGHNDIRTTQKIYAKIDFTRIHRETQTLINKKADAVTPALISESV